MALDNFNAVAAELDAAADRLMAKAAADETALATVKGDLANADASATAVIQPILDKLNGAAPAA